MNSQRPPDHPGVIVFPPLIWFVLMCGSLIAQTSRAEPPVAVSGNAPPVALETHEALDWSAPFRWVHFDTVDSSKAQIFEASRLGWLKILRKGDRLLGDGRPLFWHARAGARQTYFTFYPLSTFAALDARRDMIRKTEAAVGRDAVNQYDAGDVALLAPHYTQIWRRSPADDFVSTKNKDATELSAAFGRIEIRQVEPRDGDRVDQLWKEIRAALSAADYPISCRVFQSSYGAGDTIFLWLASDRETLSAAPSLEAALARQLGKQEGSRLSQEWKRLVFGGKTLSIERRADLSNLGK